MKSECWSCGQWARMPLSYRHWCGECEARQQQCEPGDHARIWADEKDRPVCTTCGQVLYKVTVDS